MKGVADAFERELTRRAVTFKRQDHDQYEVVGSRGLLNVSIANLQRDVARDRDPEAVVAFVEHLLSIGEVPPWSSSKSLVFWSAEPPDHDFGDAIRARVTDTVTRVLVVTDEEESLLTWVMPDQLRLWNVEESEVRAAADRNQSRLLDNITLEVDSVAGLPLGMVPLHSPLKASVIFAPNLKSFVATALGWPVIAVIPCRDFIYLIRAEHDKLLGRMGAVVQREYRNSGYPITTEVLRISDDGIEAIGRFPE